MNAEQYHTLVKALLELLSFRKAKGVREMLKAFDEASLDVQELEKLRTLVYTMHLNTALGELQQEGYDQRYINSKYYLSGFDDGYEEGYREGRQEGFTHGFDECMALGEQNGNA